MLQYLGNSFRPLVECAPVARTECGGVRSEKGLARLGIDPLICTSRGGPHLGSSPTARGQSFKYSSLATSDRMWSVKRINCYPKNDFVTHIINITKIYKNSVYDTYR